MGINEKDMEDDDEMMVTLTLDDDTEVECVVITIFEAAGKDYIALLPTDELDDESDGEFFIYAYSETEDGEGQLANIESDEEYDVAAEAFSEWLDQQAAEAEGLDIEE